MSDTEEKKYVQCKYIWKCKNHETKCDCDLVCNSYVHHHTHNNCLTCNKEIYVSVYEPYYNCYACRLKMEMEKNPLLINNLTKMRCCKNGCYEINIGGDFCMNHNNEKVNININNYCNLMDCYQKTENFGATYCKDHYIFKEHLECLLSKYKAEKYFFVKNYLMIKLINKELKKYA